VIYINPDSFLGQPRIWSPERSKAAWERCYLQLSAAVAEKAIERLYIVFGLQGAGKTHWIRTTSKTIIREPAAVFDAALPAARHRARAIEIALSGNVPAFAIWVHTPLNVALERNASRPEDERVPREAVESVAELLEAPTFQEGFSEIYRIDPRGDILSHARDSRT
jgi:predicted kinase